MDWIPLESNPEVLNKYAHNLGLPSCWNFMDVFSLDEDVLAMLPQPVASLLFIYPITEQTESSLIGEELELSDDVYFMTQTVSNACGTVAILHAIGNKLDQLQLEKDSALERFFTKSSDTACSPEERAKLMAEDDTLNSAHEAAASEGQTEAPSRDSRTNLHFIALLNRAGRLLELDGRRDGPISHGATTEESFLVDCAGVIRRFMDRQREDLNFSIIALAKGDALFS